MTVFDETKELASRGDIAGFLLRWPAVSRLPKPVYPEELLLPLLDAIQGGRLTPREYRRLWKLADTCSEPERARMLNRLAVLRPRSPLLPRPGGLRALLKTNVAGSWYCDRLAVEAVRQGDVLIPVREPENPHDDMAIRLDNTSGIKLGYIPRAVNIRLAGLMDGGVQVMAVVSGLEWGKNSPLIRVNVYERGYAPPNPNI